MHRLLPSIALLTYLSASAGTEVDLGGKWSSKCSGSALHLVEATSISGKPVEDDMVVSLIWNNGTKTQVPLPRAWYLKRAAISSGNAGCDGLALWPQPNGLALLAIAFDGRPGGEHAAVVLLDLNRQAVLDHIADVGELNDPLRLQRTKDGWVFKVVTGAKLAKSGGEESATRLRKVAVKASKLTLEWRR